MTVYITQEAVTWQNGVPVPKFDLRPALDWGETEVLLPSGANNVVDHSGIVRVLKEKLANFGGDDYLIASGDPSMIALASAIAFQVNHGQLNLLKWERRTQSYVCVNLNIGE